MNTDDRSDGIRFALKEIPDDAAVRLIAILMDELDGTSKATHGFDALDPNVSPSGGGAAFLWADVLAIGEAADVAGDLLRDLSPLDAAKVILALFCFHRRLRRKRVALSREEFVVLLAIRRGHAHLGEIADYTGLPKGEVEKVIASLENRRYQEDIPLLDRGADGWTTRF